MRRFLLLLLILASSRPVYAQDCKAYFFSIIGRAEGSPAPDWKAVLESLPARGMGTNPQPGEMQPVNARFHGITVMIDAGGNARGRIWLASDSFVQDGPNQWFTHEIQVIADGPTAGSFVWAWVDKGGAPPRPCGVVVDPTGPQPGPPPSQGLDELMEAVAALRKQIDNVRVRVEQLEVNPPRVLSMDALYQALQSVQFDCQIGRTGPGILSHGHGCTVTVGRK